MRRIDGRPERAARLPPWERLRSQHRARIRASKMRECDPRQSAGRLCEKPAAIEQPAAGVRQEERLLMTAADTRSASDQGRNRNSLALNRARHSAASPYRATSRSAARPFDFVRLAAERQLEGPLHSGRIALRLLRVGSARPSARLAVR